MLKFFIVALFAFTAFASQDVPFPAVPDGYSLGSNNPVLHIEGFFDLLCPDCQNTWGILEPILRNTFNIATNQTLRFTVHLFPLVMHSNGFMVAQGARVIADNMRDPADMFTYFDLMFKNQADYYTPTTFNMTYEAIIQKFITLVNINMPAYAEVFADGLQYGNAQDMEARTSFKYGLTKGVTGTPTILANGIVVNGAGNFQAEDWKNFINGGYLTFPSSSAPHHAYSF